MARTVKKSAYIRVETTYGTDPDNDGSDYVWVPAFSIGEIPSGVEQLETNYMTNRGLPTAPIAGPDGGQVEMVVPVIGLPTEAGDGVSAGAGADDWYDDFWENHVDDTPTEREGEAVLSANTTDITYDAAATNLAAQDLIAVYDAAAAPAALGRAQWTQIQSGAGAGPWVVEPDFAVAPTSSAVAYAARQYIWTPGFSGTGLPTGGSSRSLFIRDDHNQIGGYVCTGGRIISRSIVAEAGQRWEDRVTWGFDAIVEDSSDKASIDSAGVGPSVTPLICTLSPVWFGGTQYATRRVEINFNIEAQPIAATSGTNGRSGWDILACNPTVTIEPLATDAIRDLKRDITQGQLLIQLGAGVFNQGGSGVLNTCCFFAHRAVVMEAERTDDGGRARQTVTFKCIDAGAFSGSTMNRFWMFARA